MKKAILIILILAIVITAIVFGVIEYETRQTEMSLIQRQSLYKNQDYKFISRIKTKVEGVEYITAMYQVNRIGNNFISSKIISVKYTKADNNYKTCGVEEINIGEY